MNLLEFAFIIYLIIGTFVFYSLEDYIRKIINQIAFPSTLTFTSIIFIIVFLPIWLIIFIFGTVLYMIKIFFEKIGFK